MQELELAMVQLKMEQPDLEYRLGRQYLPRMYQTPLTRAELTYIAQRPPLRVGYDPDRKPYSWQDAATGSAKGILPDILRDASERSGLKFSFKPAPSSAANIAGAVQLAKQIEKGTIITILPDNADKYGDVIKKII